MININEPNVDHVGYASINLTVHMKAIIHSNWLTLHDKYQVCIWSFNEQRLVNANDLYSINCAASLTSQSCFVA